jgi:hypothetical protein
MSALRIGRADHGQDLTGLRVHREEVPVVGAERTQPLLTDRDGVLGGLLQGQIQGGGDDESATIHDTRAVEILELLEDEVDEVGRLAAAILLEHEVQRRILRFIGLRLGDHLLVRHGVEHHGLPGFRLIAMDEWVVVAGRVG